MLGDVLFLQSFGYFGGGAIGNFLNQWAQAGVFSYAIPFLLIFALTFGILSKMNIFGQNSKPINAIISLSVGLMALQFPTVTVFFSSLFPAVGVGLGVILALMIISGFWMNDPENTGWFKGMAFVSIVVVIIVFLNSGSSSYGWGLGFGFQTFWGLGWGTIVFWILLIGAIAWIIGINSNPKKIHVENSPARRG